MATNVTPVGYVGEIVSGDTTRVIFNTVNDTGTPTSIVGGTVAVRNLSTGTTTQVGVSFTVDYQGVTGSHRVEIDTSSVSDWPKNFDYSIEITAGTVDGTTITGTSVAQFTVSGKSSGRLYDQVVKCYAGTVTNVDGTQPGRVFTATVQGISNTTDILKGQVCTFQPKGDNTGSNNQGTGRTILKTATAGVDAVTITCDSDFKDPVALGDEFVILPEERELTIYTANITVEWGFGQSSPKNVDKYSLQWLNDGALFFPSDTPTMTAARLEVFRWSDDVKIVDVSWPVGSLSLGANSGVFKYTEGINLVPADDGATMHASITIDGNTHQFSRTLFNYV